ncbi:MAG: biosynthetic peptidoglycan transglycosylase [Acidobacteriota bacterium]
MTRRRLRRAVTAAAALALVVFCIAAVWWWRVPVELGAWRSGPPPHPWAAWQRQEAVWRAEGVRRRISHAYVPLDHISVEVPLAVLVSEDISFFAHGAIDLEAVKEAVRQWQEGHRLRGASTISQQLAKNLFLSGERTLWRKLEEARLANAMERSLGKRRILELYLNVVEFGPGLLGVEAAAQHDYGSSAAALDAAQAAGLAAAIPSPGRDTPITASQRWEVRRGIILARMARASWLRERLERLRLEPAAAPTSGGGLTAIAPRPHAALANPAGDH